MTDRHGCGFTWCTSLASMCPYEHVGDSEIEIGDHDDDVEAIAAYAFVTADPNGKVYEDEIVLNVYGRDRKDLALVSLTDHEAAQIRDMLDAAIAHRAEVRGGNPMSLKPIECVPWCSDGDGHIGEVFREDQRCYSPFVYVDSSLQDGQISVHARKDIDSDPVAELHVYGFAAELDETLHFTAEEARRIAAQLLHVADNLDCRREVKR